MFYRSKVWQFIKNMQLSFYFSVFHFFLENALKFIGLRSCTCLFIMLYCVRF